MLALVLTVLAHAAPMGVAESAFYDSAEVKACFVPLVASQSVPELVEWTVAIDDRGSAVLERLTPESLPDDFQDCARKAVATVSFEATGEGSTLTLSFRTSPGGRQQAAGGRETRVPPRHHRSRASSWVRVGR